MEQNKLTVETIQLSDTTEVPSVTGTIRVMSELFKRHNLNFILKESYPDGFREQLNHETHGILKYTDVLFMIPPKLKPKGEFTLNILKKRPSSDIPNGIHWSVENLKFD